MITPDASVLHVMAKLTPKTQNVLRRNAALPELKVRTAQTLRSVVLLSDEERKILFTELRRFMSVCCGAVDCSCIDPLDRCTFLDE